MRVCSLLVLLLLPSQIIASLFCPHTAYPSSDSDFEELRIEVHVQDDPIQLGQPIYRLKRSGQEGEKEANQEKFRPLVGQPPFRLFTSSRSSECPKRGCLHELALAEPRVPGTLFYHTDTVMGKLIPPGFLTVEASPCRLYCAIVKDDCGASVPIYRHFKVVGPRVYYAYSTSEEQQQQQPADSIGANFTRETMPMCFGWSTVRSPVDEQKRAERLEREKQTSRRSSSNAKEKEFAKEKEATPAGEKAGKKQQPKQTREKMSQRDGTEDVAAALLLTNGLADVEEEEDKQSTGDFGADQCRPMPSSSSSSNGNNGTSTTIGEDESRDAFAALVAYDNQKLGTLRDHLYTTKQADQLPGEYKKQSELGLVLLDPARWSICSSQCLLKVGQMLANRSGDGLGGIGLFPMRDHKPVVVGKESADAFYVATGEFFYCARQAGQCGAQLPVKRFWHLTELDTLLTVNSSAVPAFSIPTWDRVLCYIWSSTTVATLE